MIRTEKDVFKVIAMKDKFIGLKPNEAKTIIKTFLMFNIFSIAIFSIGAFNIGAANGHIISSFAQGAIMVIVTVGFLISAYYFSRLHKELLKISKSEK